MKILFISNRFPPDFVGGYEISACKVARQLSRRGHEVHILTRKSISSDEEDLRIYRVLNFHRASYINQSFPIFQRLRDIAFGVFFDLNNFVIAKNLLKKLKPDIVSIWNLNGVSLSPLIATMRFRFPLAIHVCDHTFPARVGQRLCLPVINKHVPNALFYSLLKRASFKVYAISNYLKNILIKQGFPSSKIMVINSGVDTSVFRPMNLERDTKFTILYVGRLQPDKGLHVLLRALVSFVRYCKEAQLIIVGNGSSDYQSTLQSMASSLNLLTAIKFLGKINHETLWQIYNKADVFVYPSLSAEPFGMAILEAMACGVPVIASEGGGKSELILNGKNGVLIKPNDAHALASALMGIKRQPNFAASIAENGLLTVRKKFSWNKIVGQVLQEYESLIEYKRSYN